MSYLDCCDWSLCTQCGECLMQCPVLALDKHEAQEEIKLLLEGGEAKRVFNECTLCYNCNEYCPIEGLKPFSLVLHRMLERREKIPEYIKYFLNGMTTPVVYQDMYAGLKPMEKEILKQWSRTPPPSEEVLWVGCKGRINCYDLEHSEVLKDLPKFGPPDLCCGIDHYRMGSWQAFEDVVERTLHRFEDLDIGRLICDCPNGYWMFSKGYPEIYGKTLPFEIISLSDWIWQRMDSGELEVKRPLNKKLAFSDACSTSELGPSYRETLRKLYRMVGAEILELEHHGDNNLCCGAMGLMRKDQFIPSFLEMVKDQRKKYREVKEAGTKTMALDCAGCFYLLGFTNYLFGVGMDYMLEDILYALGDRITTPISVRFRQLFVNFTKRMPRLLFHPGYDTLPRIPVEGSISEQYDALM